MVWPRCVFLDDKVIFEEYYYENQSFCWVSQFFLIGIIDITQFENYIQSWQIIYVLKIQMDLRYSFYANQVVFYACCLSDA